MEAGAILHIALWIQPTCDSAACLVTRKPTVCHINVIVVNTDVKYTKLPRVLLSLTSEHRLASLDPSFCMTEFWFTMQGTSYLV